MHHLPEACAPRRRHCVHTAQVVGCVRCAATFGHEEHHLVRGRGRPKARVRVRVRVRPRVRVRVRPRGPSSVTGYDKR